MLLLSLSFACTAPSVEDAGDPNDPWPFEDSDAPFTELREAGYAAVPGQYLVLVDRSHFTGFRRHLVDGFSAQLVREFELLPAVVVRAEHAEAKRLAMVPGVRAVEPDRFAWATARRRKPCASTSQEQVPAGVQALGTAPGTGAGVAVAVIDTGIGTHADLEVAGRVDLISGGSGIDDNGHGTHVAGTIAARPNGLGVVGVAPDVALYGVKVLDRRGSGSYSTIAAGLDWAVANGIDVANMSLVGGSDSAVLHEAVTSARDSGVVVVAAAGNAGTDVSDFYPAAYDGEVVTVSAWDVNRDEFPWWSNYGAAVDLAGPGVSVCSTTFDGSWGTMSGTSMATPHVAGAVAVYLGRNPTATFEQVVTALTAATTPLANTANHTEDLVGLEGF